MTRLIASLCLLCFSLTAADFTGKWVGNYDMTMTDGQSMKGTVIVNLTQSGSELTGTAGPEEHQMPILNGKADGDKVTFDLQTEGPKMTFDLRLEDEHLRGNAKGITDGTTV